MTSTTETISPPYANGIYSSPTSNGKRNSTERSAGNLNSEKNRLDTFENWPVQAPVPANRLAKAGFFYTGHGTEVQCFSCGLRIGEWSYNDIVMDKHRRFYAACEFVNNRSDNIPFIAQNSRTTVNGLISPVGATKPFLMRGTSLESSTVFQNSLGRHLENGEIPVYPSVDYHNRKSTANELTVTPQNKVCPNGENRCSSPSITEANGSHTVLESGSNGLVNSTTSAEIRPLFYSKTNHNAVPTIQRGENDVITSNSQSNVSGHYTPRPTRSATYPPSVYHMNLTPDDRRMCYEEERVKTFRPNWTLTFLNPRDLAKAGFYYLQEGDKCRCAFCRGVLMHWTAGDVPMEEHHRNFPMCPFVMGLDVGNVPANVENHNNHWPTRGIDECGHRSYEIECSRPERNSRLLPLENGSIMHKGPTHLSQATIDARLRSFLTWPSWSPMRPEHLAEAGFFYIGIRDHTKCFYCDVGLCNWEPGDDAWKEHGRWSKNCAYVVLLKGQEFIDSCQVEAESQNVIPQPTSPVTEEESPFTAAVDEAMKSNLVQSVLKTRVFPSVLIRKALLRKFRESGRGVSNVNELSEAVMIEMEESTRSTSLPPSASSKATVQNTFPAEPKETLVGRNVAGDIQKKKCETEVTAEEELRQIKESRLCKICLDQEIEVVFLPCGHQVACRQCALALKDCAICRKPVTGILRTFLP